MDDSGRDAGFNYEHSETLAIVPGQNIVVSFDDMSKSFRVTGEAR